MMSKWKQGVNEYVDELQEQLAEAEKFAGQKKTYYGNKYFNHGCDDVVVVENNRVTVAIGCNSCWSVGHDDNHKDYIESLYGKVVDDDVCIQLDDEDD